MLIQGYSDFSTETPGCHPGAAMLRAKFRLDTDVSELFPYINAVCEETVYYEEPHCIQFSLDGFRCVLYPEYGVAIIFENHGQAREFMERLILFLNDLYDRKDSLEPDHKTFKRIPAIDIFKLLPGSNCRKCGFSTCMAFAVALGQGETSLEQCPEIDDPKDREALALVLQG